MTSSSLLRIRHLARVVAEQAQHVQVDRERAAEVAASNPPPLAHPVSPASSLGAARDAERVAYFLTLGALRFGSGYLPGLHHQEGQDIERLVVGGLTERFRQHGPMEPPELLRMDAAACATLFGQRLSEPPQAELMELYARAAAELGRVLQNDFAGHFENVTESAAGSVEKLVEILARMPYYRDVQKYRGLDVPFYLRAQRVAVELRTAFEGRGPGHFEDIERATISSDDVVVQALRALGVIRIEPQLAERIERGELIPAHTEREIELRAAAILAVDALTAEFRSRGHALTPLQVDAWLRASPELHRSPPRHRSRTVFY